MNNEKLLRLHATSSFEYEVVKMILFSSDRSPYQLGTLGVGETGTLRILISEMVFIEQNIHWGQHLIPTGEIGSNTTLTFCNRIIPLSLFSGLEGHRMQAQRQFL